MATLSIINNFSLDSNGSIKTGKQGLAASSFSDEYDITVTGTCHYMDGTLANATVVTLYDDDNDFPADWDYLWFWADGTCYLQLIGSTANAVFKIAAYQPFVLPGFDVVLPAANTTLITGGTEPTMEDIDSVALGNYTTSTINYKFAVID